MRKTKQRAAVYSLLGIVSSAQLTGAAPSATWRSGGSVVAQVYGVFNSVTSAPGGVSFAGDPAIADDGLGNAYTICLAANGFFYVNRFSGGSWGTWLSTGAQGTGRASIAIGADGAAYFVYRAQNGGYWLGRYNSTGQVDGFYQLGANVFDVDPSLVGPGDSGKFFVVGGNSSGLFHSRITPSSSFFLSTVEPWSAMGGDATSGRPGVGLGADGRAYIFCLYNGAVWNAKLGGALSDFEGWWLGPQTAGAMNGELSVAASPINSQVYVAAKRAINGSLHYATTAIGTGNTWVMNWYDTGGVLADADISTGDDGIYVSGRESNGQVWWWQQSGLNFTGWRLSGSGASGRVTGTPDLSVIVVNPVPTVTHPNPLPRALTNDTWQSGNWPNQGDPNTGFWYPGQSLLWVNTCSLSGGSIEILEKKYDRIRLKFKPSRNTPSGGGRSFDCRDLFNRSASGRVDIGDLSPGITGVSPASLPIGLTSNIVITGTNLGAGGTNPAVRISLGSAGATVDSVQGWTDNQINATVTLTDTVAEGPLTLTVTSAGTGGSGFYALASNAASSAAFQVQAIRLPCTSVKIVEETNDPAIYPDTAPGYDPIADGKPIYNPARVPVGLIDTFKMDASPATCVPSWQVTSGSGFASIIGMSDLPATGLEPVKKNRLARIRGDAAGTISLKAFSGTESKTITVPIPQMHMVNVTVLITRREDGTDVIPASRVSQLITAANLIWRQAGIQFQVGSTLFIDYAEGGNAYLRPGSDMERNTLRNYLVGSNSVEIYFVEEFPDHFDWGGECPAQGCVINNSALKSADLRTVAHELGHALLGGGHLADVVNLMNDRNYPVELPLNTDIRETQSATVFQRQTFVSE